MQALNALRREWKRQSDSHPVWSVLLLCVPLLLIVDVGLIYLTVRGSQ